MKAKSIINRRVTLADNAFAELVIWEVPTAVDGSEHHYKYRLAFIHEGICRLRYDNEAGKGDHKHIETLELPYNFVSVDQLTQDFLADVRRWQDENSNT